MLPELTDEALSSDPIVLARRWFDEALAAGVDQADAMTLATATSDGRPSARAVLLKGVDERGFVCSRATRAARRTSSTRTRGRRSCWDGCRCTARCASSARSTRLSAPSPTPTLRPGHAAVSSAPGRRSRAARWSIARRWRSAGRRSTRAGRTHGSAAAALGWLSRAPDEIELWQGRATASRPLCVHAHARRGLGVGAAPALTGRASAGRRGGR